MHDRRRRVMACALAAGGLLLASSIAASRPHRWGWHRWHHMHHRWHAAAPVAGDWPAAVLTAEDAERLRPGHYIWQGDPRSREQASVTIDLDRQIAYVYQGFRLVGISTISTGRRHYETPAGFFPILEKAVRHRSTIYSGAPMPYMQRLTWGGVALHAGGVPGYRQSHGCIHLPWRFAQALYAITTLGAPVQVLHEVPLPRPALAQAGRVPTTAEAVASIVTTML